MMPLENNMKNPNHFLGICGVLNRGMSIVSMVYILIGFIGYVRYGDKVAENITANLPSDQMLVLINFSYSLKKNNNKYSKTN